MLQPLDMISSVTSLIQSCLSEHDTPDSTVVTATDYDLENASSPTAAGPKGTAAFLSSTSFILDDLLTEMTHHEMMQDSEAAPDASLVSSEEIVSGLDWEIVRALHDEDEIEVVEDEYVML